MCCKSQSKNRHKGKVGKCKGQVWGKVRQVAKGKAGVGWGSKARGQGGACGKASHNTGWGWE